jgi:hypothetical protein
MQVIVGETGEEAKAIVFMQIESFFLPRQEMSDGPMPANNSLGFTGGTGGECNVSRIVGTDTELRRRLRMLPERVGNGLFLLG